MAGYSPLDAQQSPLNFFVFSPDGQRLASCASDSTIRFWEVTTGQELLSLWRDEGVFWALAFSPDGGTLATGSSSDGRLQVWRAATEQEVRARRR